MNIIQGLGYYLMDFDGFLLQMRIEIDGVEKAAAPLWEVAARAEIGDAAVADARAGLERLE